MLSTLGSSSQILLQHAQESPGEFVKTEIPEPSPRDTNSTNLGEAAFLTSSSDAQTAAPNLDYRTVGTH